MQKEQSPIPENMNPKNTVILGLSGNGDTEYISAPDGLYLDKDGKGTRPLGSKIGDLATDASSAWHSPGMQNAVPASPFNFEGLGGGIIKTSFVMPSDKFAEITWYNTQTTVRFDRPLYRDVKDAYEQAFTNHAIIDKKIDFIYGDGLAFKGSKTTDPQEEQKRWQTNKVFLENLRISTIVKKAIFDYVNFGNACIYADKETVFENWDLEYTELVVSPEDRKVAKPIINYYPLGSVTPISVVQHDPSASIPQDEFVIRLKNEKTARNFWALPEHFAGILLYKTQYYIGRYTEQSFVRGLKPRYLVIVYGESEDERKKRQKAFQEATMGLQNMHQVVFQTAAAREEGGAGISIVDLEKRNDGEFLELETKVREGICQTHQFPPVLACQETAGKLGSRKEILDAYNLVRSTYVRSRQQYLEENLILPILRLIDQKNSTTLEQDFLGIKNTPPVSPIGEANQQSTSSTNEHRTADGLDVVKTGIPEIDEMANIPIIMLPFWLDMQKAKLAANTSTNNPPLL